MKTNIALISPGTLPIPPVKGGATETLIGQFIDENEIHKDFNIVVYSIYNKESFRLSKGYNHTKFIFIKSNKLRFKFTRLVKFFFRNYLKFNISNHYISIVTKDLIKKDIDVVLIENKPEFVLEIKRHSHLKVVQHIHNDYMSINNNKNNEILDLSDSVLFVSNAIKNNVEWHLKYDDFSVVHNGVDIEKFDLKFHDIEKIQNFRKKLGISESDIVITYIGRLNQQKGILELIESVKLIKASGFKLLVVGSSWYSKNTENKFTEILKKKSKELREKIIFTGYMDHSDIPQVYLCSDIIVVPSQQVEAAGLVVIEARASGKPVIASNSGGIPEYADGNCVIIDLNKQFVENLAYELNKNIINNNYRKLCGQKSLNEIGKYSKLNYYNSMKNILSEYQKK